MAGAYIRLFSMNKVTVYIGNESPDKSPPPDIIPSAPLRAIDQYISDSEQQQQEMFKTQLKQSEAPILAADQKDGWVAYGISVQKCLYIDFKLLSVIRMYPFFLKNFYLNNKTDLKSALFMGSNCQEALHLYNRCLPPLTYPRTW